jgi:hypothetical protein
VCSHFIPRGHRLSATGLVKAGQRTKQASCTVDTGPRNCTLISARDTRSVCREVANRSVYRAKAKEYARLTILTKSLRAVDTRNSRKCIGHSARYLEVLRRLLAAIFNNFVLDHLPFIEGTQARAFNRGDMNEYVLASAALRLNETITFLRIEPLHRAARHRLISQLPILILF